MEVPKVVRLRKSQGIMLQGCDIYIGRSMYMGGWELPESIWHNPFKIDKDDPNSRKKVIEQFDKYFEENQNLQNKLHLLSGKVLGCWCKPEACHGDVIVKHFRKKFNV